MTENLRLTGQRTLTSSDSNVSSNWTLPAVNETFPTSCVNTAYNMKSSTDATTYASYGNYYNWYAATAGTGTCAMTSGNATASICPKGWRLPTGSTTGEFQLLYTQYSAATNFLLDPLSFVLSGRRVGDSTGNQNSYGYYWSNMSHASDDAYGLGATSSSFHPASYYGKHAGLAIRCMTQ